MSQSLKCYKCTKNVSEQDNCIKCNKFYHPSCASLVVVNSDGSYTKCCKIITRSLSPGSSNSGNDFAVLKAIADLQKSFQTRFDNVDSKLDDLINRISNNETKVDNLTDRITAVEGKLNKIDKFENYNDLARQCLVEVERRELRKKVLFRFVSLSTTRALQILTILLKVKLVFMF